MADVILTGGGIVGTTAAMLLAKDGHRVTVLERDPYEPPDDPRDAWTDWERRGVNQFRLLHYLQPRFRHIIEAELPEAVSALDAAGASRINLVALIPDEMKGGSRPDDDRFATITARRPVAEAALAKAARDLPGVDVRRGTAVAGLLVDGTSPSGDGAPHVVGVCTESGEELRADVVIDCTGRRSPLPAWLDAIGARRPDEEMEDSGFVYYGRHFRSADGSHPALFGPPLYYAGSVAVLTLPADNGTWGVGIIGVAGDSAVRGLRDADRWTEAMRAFPLHAHWVDGEPIDDEVFTMAKLEDRRRRFVVDGAPVATGVLPLGDSWACTNPSLGRGIAIGAIHAVALRDTLRGALDDPVKLALEWDHTTAERVGPYYDSVVFHDRHRLTEMTAAAEGRTYGGDETWDEFQSFQAAAGSDPDVLRAMVSFAGVLMTPDEALALPGIREKARAAGAGWRDASVMGPTREQLVAIAAG